MKKTLIAIVPLLLIARAFATDAPAALIPAASNSATQHRYLVERTFPAGALEGLDAAGKAKINATNAKYNVTWLMSYANASQTHTYCIYKGPSEDAVRQAAAANKIPVDSVTEVPVTLSPN